MLFVFSANMHTFFYDNKGVFIDVFQSTAEMNTFIFGKDRNDHISCFFGITTTRLPLSTAYPLYRPSGGW